MLSPKLIIFDLDGTLVEFPKNYLFSELERILPLIQVSIPEKTIIEDNFASFNFFGFAPEEQQAHVQNAYWQHFNWQEFPNSRAFSFTPLVLEQLRAMEIKNAIATARHCMHQELIQDIHGTGILDFFHFIEVRRSANADWKDKRPQIEKILEASSCDPKDAMMVGDIPADIESAKLCGLGSAIAVLSGGIKEEVLRTYQPDLIIPDVSYLAELIKK